MKKLIGVFILIIMLITTIPVGATQCQLNSGSYITHSKTDIVRAWNYTHSGRWSQLRVMASQGDLRKVSGGPYHITVIEANDRYVKFFISITPGKEIWTLTIFTQGCN